MDWPDTRDPALLRGLALHGLSKLQEEAVDLAIQGRSFFLTGPGGTGKSTVIRRITKYLECLGKKFWITAPTGIAAIQIGGQTIHRSIRTGIASLYLTNGATLMENVSLDQYRNDFLEPEMRRLGNTNRKRTFSKDKSKPGLS